MLELDFRHRVTDVAEVEHARLRAALAAALTAERNGGPRAGIATLLSMIGIRPGLMHESYFAEALAFHSAQTHAHLRESREMAECILRSHTLPADGGDLLFANHVARSLRLFDHREAARARGMPTFLIASMARASSTSLTQSLAQSLDMPVIRVSMGRFPHYALAPSWLDSVSPGGAVLHDHFGATSENLSTLRNAGVREVFVLVRDPRAAAASYVNFVGTETEEPASDCEYEAMVLSTYRNAHLPWLEGWLAASRAGDLRVQWIRSRAVGANLPEVWRDLLSAHAALYPALIPYLDVLPTEVRANFVNGADDHWRRHIGNDAQGAMWRALSPAAIELLELAP